MKKLVIASHNTKKRDEIVALLSGLEIEVLTLADFPGAPEPEETGETYLDNALIKARSGAAFTGEWCLADDSGLEIDGLPGELGVCSARFGGDVPFETKMEMVLARLSEQPEALRAARFRCVIALVRPASSPVEAITFKGTCEGRIAHEISGAEGFGYDPIFIPLGYDLTFAELPNSVKSEISHRAQALAQLRHHLTS